MTNLSQLLPSFVIAQTVHRRVNKTVWPPVSGHAKGFMQRGRRHPVDLSRAVRPRGYGDYSWHPYQHLRPFGTQRRARLWGQCVLEHLQHRRFFFWRWRFASSRPIGLHGRLPASELAVIRDQGQPDSACTIVDISLGGAKNCGSPAGVGESRRSRRFIAARRRFATTFPVSSAGPKGQVLAMGSVLFSRREFRCAVRLRPDSSPVPITARSTTSTCLKCCSPPARDSAIEAIQTVKLGVRGNERLQDESGGRFLRARRGKGRMPSDVRTARSRPPIKSRASSSGILLIKCRRRHGRIALIASLARGSIFSRTKVCYPAQATGLKQILLCIANSLR